MNSIPKKIVYLITFTALISSAHHIFADLQWMKSNYWFAGYMYITGDPNLTYKICYWNDKTQKMELAPITFFTNTVIDISTLSGGNALCLTNNLEQTGQGCIQMGWDSNNNRGTAFLLVPELPFSDFTHPENEQSFENDLKAGKLAPYIYIERNAGIINIYILGPTAASKFAAQKLSFNFLAFEQVWVQQTKWYHDLISGALVSIFSKDKNKFNPGMLFSFSFDAPTGTFANTPGRALNDDAFYIFGIANATDGHGWSWMHQGPENISIKGMTAATLQGQGILQLQGPFIDTDELQGAINFINWTGFGKFDNVK